MQEIFKELEKIVINDLGCKDINNLLHFNEDMYSFKNIKKIDYIFYVYKKVKSLYKSSLKWLKKNISYINQIKKMMQNIKTSKKKNTNIFNDLFLEVESMISFFELSFTPYYELVMQYEYNYHYLKSLFIYLFSIFDKLAILIHFHHTKGNEIPEKELRKIKFNDINSYLKFDNKIKNVKLSKRIDLIINSPTFKLVLKIRNISYHRFDCPIFMYHLSTNIMICFIVVITVFQIVQSCFKKTK